MEALHSNAGGGIENIDLHVSNLGHWNHLWCPYVQMGTMLVEQGMMMDRMIGSFSIPAASFIIFDVISVIFWFPVYDRILVSIARKFTGKERGFSK